MAKEEKKSNKSMMIIIILLLVILIVGGAFAFLILSKSAGANNPQKVVEEVITLDESVVNIKDLSMKRYVKFSLAITYDAKNKKVLEDINSNNHKIKDAIIGVFKEKTASDIEVGNGIEVIKNEIKTKIDEILEDNSILSVYFTNLLIH